MIKGASGGQQIHSLKPGSSQRPLLSAVVAPLTKIGRGGDRRSASSRLAMADPAMPSLPTAPARSRLRASATVALAVLAALFWVASGSEPALGSCAVQSLKSSDAFPGVVVSTRSHGRVATVLTDGGARVEVWGTPDIGSAATSVDRTYEVGGRYEFHPTNSASPYRDNACTATQLLSLISGPSSTPSPSTAALNDPPVLTIIAGGLAALTLVSAIMIRRMSHRTRPPTHI